MQELNETGVVTAADVAAAAAQAAKDEVEALKTMVETEEAEVKELQRQVPVGLFCSLIGLFLGLF